MIHLNLLFCQGIKKQLGGRWVYVIKEDLDGNKLFKARYVGKGYSQIYVVDYFESFSPTARIESLRVLMQISVQNDLIVHQMDAKSAYLHAPIECELYISQPEGFINSNDNNSDELVWKLKKSLCGLKQSGRNWHFVLKSTADPCVYIRRRDDELVIILVLVDDIISCNSNNLMIEIRYFKSKV